MQDKKPDHDKQPSAAAPPKAVALRLTINKKINLGLIACLIVLIFVGVVAYITTQRLITAGDARVRSLQAADARDALLADLFDAESAQRGFLITGQENYLVPFNAFELKLSENINHIAQLQNDANAADTATLQEIQRLIEARMAILKKGITVRRSQGFASAQSLVASGEGKELSDQVRVNVTLLDDKAQKNIEKNTQDAQKARQFATATVLGGSVIALIIVIAAMYLISRDLRARQISQDALADSKMRLQAILDNMSEGLVVADMDGNFTSFNKAAEKILGIGMMKASPDEWAKTYGNFKTDKITPFPTEDFPLMRALKGEEVQDVEIYVKNKNVEAGRYISVSGSTLRDPGDAIIGSIAVFGDITKRKEAERKVVSEKAKAEATLSSIGDGVFVVDTTGTILLFNKAAEDISGFSAKEITGQSYNALAFQSEKDGSAANNFIATALSGQKTIMASHTVLRRKDGAFVPVADSASPITNNTGAVEGAVVVFRDTTRERQLESMKDEFLAVASHELRTPMGAVRATLAMILDGDYGPLNKELVEPLRDMKISTVRLVELVNDLLDLNRIEAGRTKFDLSDFDLRQVLQSTVNGLAPLGKEKNVQIVLNPGESGTVQADTNKVSQVIINLIGNALKFTQKGSIIVSMNRQKDMIEVAIVDTGIGISVEDQKLLFGKFKQISSVQAGKPIGTGLGLYISRDIIRKMGGELGIKVSAPGKGSTFVLTIPVAQSAAALRAKKIIEREAVLHVDQR